ncbi:Dcp2, box A domain-containing protein [Mucor mucedo]|uniref:Dcp2, box A domain-containing protein n=1 Tax=Mucor mucedo TaxID=29922 RepID=UPI0022208285|nr:Dcp2, box A domain-containing protein [Mucor mucedo]KAI7891760.1 Dcp2, box A domain-containing protein [Mucor mucedo]
MQSSAVFFGATFEEILDDLSSRFIINVPEAELSSVERICFQVEQAHWFYEDFIRELKPELPSFQLKTFSARIFKHCPLLHQWAHEHERAYADFMQYRFRIPVCGAIILNANLDKCVLVKGWSSKSGWGFPKGKINQDEEYDCCAIREVLEETGYDVGPLLKKPDYIELTMREQRIRLYIIQGVPEDTLFIPRTRKEISQISWIKLDDLPTYKTTEPRPGNGSLNYVKSGPYRFYMVVPFMNKLRQFVNQRKKILRKDHKAEKIVKESASPLGQSNTALAKQPVETSNALKSLLGVGSEGTAPAGFAASPAVSQPQPEHQPPNVNGNNMLQELFASSQQPSQSIHPQQQPHFSPQQQQFMQQQQFAQQQHLQHQQHQQINILQQLQQASVLQQQQQHQQQQQQFQQQQLQQQSPQNGTIHRASFVEELLKANKGNTLDTSSANSSPLPSTDNLRRNSLLSVLQGRPKEQTPPPQQQNMNPLDAFLHPQAIQSNHYATYAD